MILQQHANKDKMQGISNILVKAKVRGEPTVNGNDVPIEIPLVPRKCVLFPHHPCLSCSLFLAFSSLASVAFPPSPMVVLLTFSHLLVSRMCMLFPHCPCFSSSLFLTFLSLGCVCFSRITHVCLAHFFLPSCL
jgi:hypothetical protein